MVYVYYTWISADFQCNLFDHYLFTLPVNMRTKIGRYRRWEDQQATLLGKLLMRKGFERLNYKTDPLLEVQYTSYGRPFLEGKIDFNISHSGNFVVCAVSDTNRVGIDIEQIRDIDPLDFKPQMTKMEWEEINNSKNKTTAFYNYWTKKEAIIKVVGKGLSIPLRSFTVSDTTTEINNKIWYLKKLEINNNCTCHLALDKKIDTHKISVQEIKITTQN